MTSNFKQQRDDVISTHLQNLIQHVCNVEVGSKNYKLAHDFAVNNLYDYQFLDTNPNQIERSKS